MSLINNFFIRIFSKKVGEDNFGNSYYQNNKLDYLGRRKRQIIYHGEAEASKVPPMWHAWLHYMINELPSEDNKFAWQLNVTSTKLLTKTCTYNKWKPH